MTKNDCKWIACVYALKDGCSIGEPREKCAYYGDGTCSSAVCKYCGHENTNVCEEERLAGER